MAIFSLKWSRFSGYRSTTTAGIALSVDILFCSGFEYHGKIFVRCGTLGVSLCLYFRILGVYAAAVPACVPFRVPCPAVLKMIHPLEAFGYYLQLYSPPFVFAMPVMSFMLYMMVCGTCGVLDHSGIKLSVPGIYDTKDHDRHHSRFEVNYAFPFPVMDVLHGTYDGCFLGRRYSCSTRERLHKWIGT